MIYVLEMYPEYADAYLYHKVLINRNQAEELCAQFKELGLDCKVRIFVEVDGILPEAL